MIAVCACSTYLPPFFLCSIVYIKHSHIGKSVSFLYSPDFQLRFGKEDLAHLSSSSNHENNLHLCTPYDASTHLKCFLSLHFCIHAFLWRAQAASKNLTLRQKLRWRKHFHSCAALVLKESEIFLIQIAAGTVQGWWWSSHLLSAPWGAPHVDHKLNAWRTQSVFVIASMLAFLRLYCYSLLFILLCSNSK